ncbi:2-hydroxyhepta-2,4-diene-1,7-dioate isomerase [Nocardioides silvaticus]|uniref:2-hydroxyhepta-2,4-diene-1,7-dioate isomerase n=1 Tax=Nocardioides silvaticus TaxID=2201891 RepID=A0A316TBM6_9ACTN|nr:fumarylacetoacetate hydrolase family protein [Nocardioides silvaticus]PWN01820.1 2-hydroxyhepta-2,4-diene-1,7-dioate isomerase [Nocardioides silvaticus]
MRIARFTTGDEPSYGVVTGDLDQFGQPAEDAMVVELAGDPMYVGLRLLEKEHRLRDVKLLAPVLPRSKVVGVGKNYAKHAAEMGGDQPAEPLLFLKPNTSVIGPDDAILYPSQTSHLSYEGEVAVVIGRICRDVPPEQATDVIFGYTIANDVTARDLQKTDNQWARAKGMDTFCPLGPWIENDLDPQAFIDGRRVQTFLNGDVVQDGTTSDMSWNIPDLVAYISSAMTLLPGDVILTGTPEGVGPMEPGDEVEVFVEGLGALTNTVARRERA